MPRYAALFLAVLIGCQAFHNAGVVGYWLANRAYIATTLCENRDRPQMRCNGKCYLKKKLAPAKKAPVDAQEFPSLKKGLELAESIAIPALIFLTYSTEPAVALPSLTCRYAVGHRPDVFHPPAAGC
jgi:hypothetical protein